ncbi:tripartite tricarboxylate transporter TctB family protein [Oceanispirochaeta crateris]|uniref:Tripartite tricarboxylate transporter TctB family protein n=2 Tax=Oceanispirochaeta crateris TaxID=2518645 RepID=A0A5C1QR69_9SPIO|nr:tripartite tricarboxylate transporter TctB family protein [Oceanispirochaeta crateris]
MCFGVFKMNNIKRYLQSKVIIPLCVQVVLTIYVVSALQLAPPIVNRMLSESSFPFVIFLIATPAAIKLLFDGVKEVKTEISEGKEIVYVRKSIKPLLIVLIMAVFILLFELLGFSILAPLYVFFFMLVYDDRPEKIVKKISYSLLVAIVVYVMYVFAFDIRFPEIWR